MSINKYKNIPIEEMESKLQRRSNIEDNKNRKEILKPDNIRHVKVNYMKTKDINRRIGLNEEEK